GPPALNQGARAAFDQRPNLGLPLETTQSPASLELPPRAQAWWQGATAPTSAQSNLSANLASPQLASPAPVSTTPAAPFAPTRSTSQQRPTQPAAHRSLASLDLPSHLASPQPVVTTPAAPFAPTRSTSQQRPTQYAAQRSPTSLDLPSHLASPQPVFTTPAAPFAPTRSTLQQRPTEFAARRSPTLLDISPPLALQQLVATSPATTLAPARSTSQPSPKPAPARSTFAPGISSPLAPPQSAATTPVTAFPPPHPTSQRPPRSTAARPTNPPKLLAPPNSVAKAQASPPFPHFQSSKSTRDLSPTDQLIAELQATAAYLDWQYKECVRGVHSMIENQVYRYTTSLVHETDSAQAEFKAVMEQIAAVDKECAKFQALYEDECDKFPEAEIALEKAQMIHEDTDREQAELYDEIHELQWGEAVGGKWVPRDLNDLRRDSASSQPASAQAKEDQDANTEAVDSPHRAKKVVKSWDSQWEPLIAEERYSLPRAAPAPSQASQGSVVASNAARMQTTNGGVHETHQPYYEDYNGQPLLWGQLAPESLLYAPTNNPRSSKHA
ncbi:hypothetical protein FRC01_012615, partial [Tulasnella sp. 417]